LIIVLAAVALAAFTSGWVLRDAQARDLGWRKAVTWAVLSVMEWPVFLLLYRRARPRTTVGTRPPRVLE
jgi:hypothetical protein